MRAMAKSGKDKDAVTMTLKKYPGRVKEVLEYVNELPVKVYGAKLEYRSTKALASTSKRKYALYDRIATMDLCKDSALSSNTQKRHYAQLTKGLLYIGVGALDEAHNIVTPLSWPSRASWADSAPISIKDATLKGTACYAHALVHRGEGQYVGEFGTGWNNSQYWFANVPNKHPVYGTVSDAARSIVTQRNSSTSTDFGSHRRIVKFVGTMGGSKRMWNAGSFVDLCEIAVDNKDALLVNYCEQVINQEWKALLDFCLRFVDN